MYPRARHQVHHRREDPAEQAVSIRHDPRALVPPTSRWTANLAPRLMQEHASVLAQTLVCDGLRKVLGGHLERRIPTQSRAQKCRNSKQRKFIVREQTAIANF